VGSSSLVGLLGRNSSPKVEHDYYHVKKVYQDIQREKTKNFDGTVSYGDWKVIREYTEESRE
jgi:hypothetical protein